MERRPAVYAGGAVLKVRCRAHSVSPHGRGKAGVKQHGFGDGLKLFVATFSQAVHMLPVRDGIDLSDTLLRAPRGKWVTEKDGVAVGEQFAGLADVLHKLLESEQSIGFASEWNNVGVTRVAIYEHKRIFTFMHVGDGPERLCGVLHKVG